MSDANSTSPSQFEEPNPHSTDCCPRCSVDLSARLRKALFCPQCGLALAEAAKGQTITQAGQALAVERPADCDSCKVVDLVAEWEAYEATRSSAVNSVGGRSDIVAGYAKALFRLGWEYERRSGYGRNLGEAIRCYKKAARHGNAEAIARLAPQCAAVSRPSFNAGADASHS